MELGAPPAGAALGDRISVPGIAAVKPVSANKSKKMKLIEKVLPHLRTNDDRCVTYKGVAVQASAGGACTVDTLTNANVV